MSHLQAPRSTSWRAASGVASESETDAGKYSDATLTANEDSSAEEPGLLIPLKSQSPPVVEDEDDKCWICFESRADELIESSNHGVWRKPCKCALTAHEGCLLDWISDLEKTPSSMNKPIQCPQCKSNILLRQERSTIVELGKSIERNVRRTNSVAIVAGLGSAFFVTSTVYGVNAIYLICGTKEANAIILGPGGRDFQWTWRLAVGLPVIPLILVVSRTRLLDATLPILPLIFFCHTEPFHLTLPPSPAITLALLPYVRSIYEAAYNKFLLPWDKKWTTEIGPTAATLATDDNDVGLEIQVVEMDENEEEEEVANGNADAHAPVAHAGADAGAEGQDAWRVERELVLGPETANLVVGALLFPGVVASMGGLLGKIPFIRKILPERFHRNILGGCLFVLIKDIFTLYYKYKRAKQRRSREILNYQKRAPRREANATTGMRR
ncbi:hypothetical protein H072_7496 [Dactylellina haptotyla CBS 200.50]|uniref:RING-CH-type domain-containing protein n=1 Tax=Dactylellina haptotyla (strain CBS 200.50) TaxID=1284197 RepID=S8ACF6_DACHA|nr:hypothetical protein H072_7496 [Dactylellina haptotyla CBS 200.50]